MLTTFLFIRYVEDGSPKALAQNYTNVVNPPLITGDDDMLLLDVINIPGLHVMTGNVGKLVGELEKTFPDKEEGRQFVSKFLATINVERAEYQGSHSFEGNHARKLLRRISLLQPAAQKLPIELRDKVMKFISTLQAFNKVVVACFGKTIEGDHEEAIREYSRLYRALGISIPPKVHTVEAHVVTYLARRNAAGGTSLGLGAWTEQAFESCHHDFRVEWEKVSVSPDHPEYEMRLLEAVIRYDYFLAADI